MTDMPPLPPTCSHCGFPLIGSSSSFRHYGTHTAHQENECLRLLIADRDALRAGLADAIESLKSWGEYASPYFRDKWDLDGDIKRLQTLLKGEKP